MTPWTPDELDAEASAFLESLGDLGLDEAIRAYHERMGAHLARALGDTAVACAAGCSACCHQPLAVSFLELAWLYFSDEPRFAHPTFRSRLRDEQTVLARWRREGARDPGALAARQWAERRPCVMLGRDGRCTVHSVRPFQCRNAWSRFRCTAENAGVFGFPELAVVARRLRRALHERYELQRHVPAGLDLHKAVFYLPEGLQWLVRETDLDALRPLFRGRSRAAGTR